MGIYKLAAIKPTRLQRPTKRRHISFIKVKTYLAFFIVILCFFPFVKECNRRGALKNDQKGYLKAVVTYDKAYKGNDRVSLGFYYKYSFKVNGKDYIGKTMDEKYRPGDSIEIEYVTSDPSKNSPKDYYK